MPQSKVVKFWNERPIPTSFPWTGMHELLWSAGGSKPLKVLDLAAGNGSLSIPLLERECDITATELGPKLIRHLESIRSPGGKAMTVINEDIRQGMPAEGVFDLVICSFIIHFFSLPDGNAVLETVRRSVKPGGMVWLRWFLPQGELAFGYDHCVPSVKQVLSHFPGAKVLHEHISEVPTASLRPDKTPMLHTAADVLLRA